MSENEYISLSKALLIFWRTITSVACQAQTSIVTSFKAFDFSEDAMQSCLKNLFSARQNGELTSDDCLLLQHDKLILEQLGIPASELSLINRCTLGVLSQILFNFDGKTHKSDKEYKKICDEPLENLAHCYYLLSASKNSDLYLNVAFGLLLDRLLQESKQEKVYVRYNDDKEKKLDLVAVDLIRGSVENSVYCSSDCTFKNAGDHHSVNCKSRGATWILLTFADKRNGEKRQIHCDVAMAAYNKPQFYDQYHPYPCEIGFFPVVDDSVRQEFEKRGWPIGAFVKSKPLLNTHYHRISSYDCVLPLRSHYDYICSVMNSFEDLTRKNRTLVLLWYTLQRALLTNDSVNSKKLSLSLQKLTTMEKAQQILAEFICIVDVNTEAQSLQVFLQALPLFLKYFATNPTEIKT